MAVRPFERCRERAPARPRRVKAASASKAENLGGSAATVESDQNGDQPTNDVRVGVAAIDEPPVFAALGDQPHLTGAAAHPGGLGAFGLGKRGEIAAEVDDVAVALLPVAEQVEGVGELVEPPLDRAGATGVGEGHGSVRPKPSRLPV